MKVTHSKEMQAWEQETIQSGVTVSDLMRSAVDGCFQIIRQEVPSVRSVLVFCGKGNNGNDAIELAYQLEKAGWPVQVVLSHPQEERTPPPFDYLKDFVERAFVWPDLIEELESDGSSRLVIDGLLGIGAKGAPQGSVGEIIQWCSRQKGNRDIYVSIDCPSGLDPDTGEGEEGKTFPADITCAIGAVKRGCLKDCAYPYTGKIFGISIPLLDLKLEDDSVEFVTEENIAPLVLPVPHTAHKYSRGVLHIWAGSPGMLGAAFLSSYAAIRSGVGLVRLYVPERFLDAMALEVPEVITCPLDSEKGFPDSFFECDAHMMGPGLGREPLTCELFRNVLPRLQKPVVFDADALYFLSLDTDNLFSKISSPFILTPHRGEMQRLVQGEIGDRGETAKKWTQQYQGTLVLKGPHTIIAQKGGALAYNSTGNAGMSTAGMGDVLAGLIGGLLAQGYNTWDAARLGVFWHGLAADVATLDVSKQSLTASDAIDYLGIVWKSLYDWI